VHRAAHPPGGPVLLAHELRHHLLDGAAAGEVLAVVPWDGIGAHRIGSDAIRLGWGACDDAGGGGMYRSGSSSATLVRRTATPPIAPSQITDCRPASPVGCDDSVLPVDGVLDAGHHRLLAVIPVVVAVAVWDSVVAVVVVVARRCDRKKSWRAA